jgi:hypothetical protein
MKILLYRPAKANKYHERETTEAPVELRCAEFSSEQLEGSDILKNTVYTKLLVVGKMADIMRGDTFICQNETQIYKVMRVVDLPSALSGSVVQKIIVAE